jgi:RimJ/RimL family protein N-acetyltransferase
MSFDLQPCLKGDFVELRPLRASDFDALYAVAVDPLIWEQHPNPDRCQKEVFQQFFREAMESGGALLALDAKDGRVIGSSRFHGYDEAKCEIEIGWSFLARSHWGGSYNRDMKHLMLRHAFRFVNSVIFVIGPHNYRSQRAVEKIGAVRVGSKLNTLGQERYVFRIEASAFTISNKCRKVLAEIRKLSVAEAEVLILVEAEVITPTTEVRGRMVGPRCPGMTTIEVPYPFLDFPHQPESLPPLSRRVVIPDPTFWDEKRPYVYRVHVELWQDGQRVDRQEFDCGLRLATKGG